MTISIVLTEIVKTYFPQGMHNAPWGALRRRAFGLVGGRTDRGHVSFPECVDPGVRDARPGCGGSSRRGESGCHPGRRPRKAGLRGARQLTIGVAGRSRHRRSPSGTAVRALMSGRAIRGRGSDHQGKRATACAGAGGRPWGRSYLDLRLSPSTRRRGRAGLTKEFVPRRVPPRR
jgi:hypothetical protein